MEHATIFSSLNRSTFPASKFVIRNGRTRRFQIFHSIWARSLTRFERESTNPPVLGVTASLIQMFLR